MSSITTTFFLYHLGIIYSIKRSVPDGIAQISNAGAFLFYPQLEPALHTTTLTKYFCQPHLVQQVQYVCPSPCQNLSFCKAKAKKKKFMGIKTNEIAFR